MNEKKQTFVCIDKEEKRKNKKKNNMKTMQKIGPPKPLSKLRHSVVF